jgi:hypothetical protein
MGVQAWGGINFGRSTFAVEELPLGDIDRRSESWDVGGGEHSSCSMSRRMALSSFSASELLWPKLSS